MAYIVTGLKNNTSIHDRVAIKKNKCLQETEWMTKENTSRFQNVTQKGTAPTTTKP